MDSKIGAAIAIPLVPAVAVVVAGRLSLRATRAQARAMFVAGRHGSPDVVREEELAGLPEPVQRWLRRSNVVGRERVRTVRLRQRGSMRMAPEKPWMPYTAVQYYTTDPPAFLWHARFTAGPLTVLDVKDCLQDGHGRIRFKWGALIPGGDSAGPEIDQGVLLRYLNETMWFPSAALSPCIAWRGIDAESAEATITLAGRSASAIYYFNEAGDVVNMTADRYRMVGNTYSLDRWATPVSNHREFQGVRVPAGGEGVWQLPGGDFPYIRLEITDIAYNQEAP